MSGLLLIVFCKRLHLGSEKKGRGLLLCLPLNLDLAELPPLPVKIISEVETSVSTKFHGVRRSTHLQQYDEKDVTAKKAGENVTTHAQHRNIYFCMVYADS